MGTVGDVPDRDDSENLNPSGRVNESDADVAPNRMVIPPPLRHGASVSPVG